MFAEPTPPEVLPRDLTLLTLAAARLMHREPATVRGWVMVGDLAPHFGRYGEVVVLATEKKMRSRRGCPRKRSQRGN